MKTFPICSSKALCGALLATSVAFVACDDTVAHDVGDDVADDVSPIGDPVAVELTFRMVDGRGDDFACGAEGLHVAGLTDVTPNDGRLYIHGVALLDEDGVEHAVALDQQSPWQHEDVALLDFEDGTGGCEFVIFGRPHSPEMNDRVVGTVDRDGPWSGVVFTLGVPVELNHSEAQSAPAPLNVTGMDHGPADGRQFIRIGFYREDDANTSAYNLMSFRSVCNNVTADGDAPDDVDDCAKPNRPVFRLAPAGGFDPASDTIVFDVAALFAAYTTPGAADGPHVDLNPAGRIDCFSPLHAGDIPNEDAEPFLGAERCGRAYPPLGLDYASGRAGAATQTFVRVE